MQALKRFDRKTSPGSYRTIRPRTSRFSGTCLSNLGSALVCKTHFIFHYPQITPVYYSSFQSIFHSPYITPINSKPSFHLVFPSYFQMCFHLMLHCLGVGVTFLLPKSLKREQQTQTHGAVQGVQTSMSWVRLSPVAGQWGF